MKVFQTKSDEYKNEKVTVSVILMTSAFLLEKKYRNYQNYTLLNLEKWQYFSHERSDKGFNGTVVFRPLPSLHEGPRETTFTVPLICNILVT